MARRIAVLNNKGGTGKSTTAVNLAVLLAQRGHRTLLIDYDNQRANASSFVGLMDVALSHGVYGAAEFTLGEGSFSPVRNVLVPGLDVLVAAESISRLERRLLENTINGNRKLTNAIRAVESDYAFVIADCGASLGMMAINAVAACPEVLVPVELAPAPVVGAVSVRDFVQEMRDGLEPKARIMGVLGTFYTDREKRPKEYLERLQSLFGDLVFRTVINRYAPIRDASDTGRPVVIDAPKHEGSLQYHHLADEVLARGAL